MAKENKKRRGEMKTIRVIVALVVVLISLLVLVGSTYAVSSASSTVMEDGSCSVVGDSRIHSGVCIPLDACYPSGSYRYGNIVVDVFHQYHTVSGSCWVKVYQGVGCSGCGR